MQSFAIVVLDGQSSGTDVDVPCRGLLLTFFRWQANQLAVGFSTKRRLHQKQLLCSVCCVGLVEVLWKRESGYAALLNAILLAKCFQAHVWENSHYVSKQLTGIGQSIS